MIRFHISVVKKLPKLIAHPFLWRLNYCQNQLEKIFPSLNSEKFKNSNAYFAISMSKRKFIYKHNFEVPVSKSVPLKTKIRFILSYIIRRIRNLVA